MNSSEVRSTELERKKKKDVEEGEKYYIPVGEPGKLLEQQRFVAEENGKIRP